jgi:hypothetical protein
MKEIIVFVILKWTSIGNSTRREMNLWLVSLVYVFDEMDRLALEMNL